MASRLNNKPDAKTVLKKLKSNESFVYLARAVDPAIADAIIEEVPRGRRRTPGPAPVSRAASLAANIVGGIDWDGHGLLGLEDSLDATLAGTDGSVTYDRGSDGVVIPGSYRNRHDAVNGSTVQLTLDDDIQFYVQQQVQQAKNASGAEATSRRSCWTRKPVRCWRCRTTTRSTRARTSAARRTASWATRPSRHRSSRAR